MRFIHTADWHLGRIFFQVHLTEDQAHVLDQLVDIAKEAKCDAVVIAGDVYDRAVPPLDAIRLLDEVISRLVLDLRVAVILIAGNHDSPERLGFGSRVMAGNGLHVFGTVGNGQPMVTLRDEAGPVHFYPVPFAEPAAVGSMLDPAVARDHGAVMCALTDRIRTMHPRGERAVVVAHAFVAGGSETDSERPLSVGGSDRVERACFEGFDYVALGHLHSPQSAGSGSIAYSGSLLKLSFSETGQTKSINVVDMDARGTCRVERVKLNARRDVRKVRGFLHELLETPVVPETKEDYVMATLLDTHAILDPMGKLRRVFPNLLHVEIARLSEADFRDRSQPDLRKLNDLDLFTSFFHEATGTPLSADQAAAYESVVEALRRREREDLQ
ncbi:MAG: exonuclease SbcCD subunit D [Thermodesulfobacteriota bacterium]